MKTTKLLVFVLIVFMVNISLDAQQLSFRITNPKIDYGATPGVSPDSLTFDVEVKCDVAGTYIRTLQILIDYANDAFGTAVAANNKVKVKKLPLIQGELVPGLPFINPSPVNDNNASRFGFTLNTGLPASPASPSFHIEVPTTYTGLVEISIEISDATQDSEISFYQPFMNGQQTHQSAAAAPVFYTNPNLYGSDISLVWLGAIYNPVDGWTPLTPDATTGSRNASVWEGSGSITAAQASYALFNNVRIHDQSSTLVGDAYLSIEPGAGLTVQGDLENPIAEGVVVQSDATGTGSLIPTGTLSGSGTYGVERYYPENNVSTTDYFFHQVAAPVDNQTLGDFDLIHTQSYAYEYRPLTDEWYNIYAPGRLTDLGYGFILSFIQNTVAQTNYFIDDISVGNHAIGIEANYYNLVGNTYPSPIDWVAIWNDAANPSLDPTVYIWEASQGTGGGGNYRAYNAQTTSGNSSCRYVQVGQAFFVGSTGASTVNINTGHRVHNDQAYLKTEPVNMLKMVTAGGNGSNDELYVHFLDFEGTSGNLDEGLDAEKWASLHGEQATEIYTVGTDNSYLTIDARPEITDAQTDIPMHFKAAVDAEYTLHAESVESFYPSIKIFLEDTFHPEQDWVDLRENDSYTFNASPEDDYDRFVLHFYDSEFGIEEPGFEPIRIYSDRTDAIIVNESEQLIKEILIYDMMGNLIDNKIEVNSDQIRMYVSDKTGYYVVKVITDKAVYSNKVLIAR